MKALTAILVVTLLAACGTVEHSVRVVDQEAFRADTTIALGEVVNKTGASFDIDIEAMLREAVLEELQNADLLARPGDPAAMSMDVNIIEYSKGDAFKRWLWPGYGSTVLVIEAALRDREGNVDATAQAHRSVDAGGGYTIGAWKKIFDEVAADLVSDLKGQVGGVTGR